MKRKENKNGGKRLVLLFIIALVSVGVFAEARYNVVSDAFRRSYKRLLPEGIRFEYGQEATPVFSRGRDGFLCVTRDGAAYYTWNGEKPGNVTFTLQSPHIVKKADNWAILEPLGRAVNVCGPRGLLYSVATEHPILNAYINSAQCLILLLETDTGYKIRIYNGNGVGTITRSFELDGIYPVCAALSDDGFIFAVSCVDTTKTTLSSNIQYFYTDSGAKRYGADMQTPFKAIEKPGSIITSVFFGGNGNLTGVSDNEIFITTPKGDEVFSLALRNKLESFSFGEAAFGFVAGSPFANAPDLLKPGVAKWYDYQGKLLAEFPPEGAESAGRIEKITVYDEVVLLKSEDGYILADINGRQIWTYGAAEDIIEIIPAGKKKAVIAKMSGAEIYSLKKPKADGEAQ